MASLLAPIGRTEPARVAVAVNGGQIIVDRLRGNERPRCIGIDTPESVELGTPVRFMAEGASAANEALVAGMEVVLERDVSDVDRYRRLLRYVRVRADAGWTFVKQELVGTGFAYAVTYLPDVRRADVLRNAERDARHVGVGL